MTKSKEEKPAQSRMTQSDFSMMIIRDKNGKRLNPPADEEEEPQDVDGQ